MTACQVLAFPGFKTHSAGCDEHPTDPTHGISAASTHHAISVDRDSAFTFVAGIGISSPVVALCRGRQYDIKVKFNSPRHALLTASQGAFDSGALGCPNRHVQLEAARNFTVRFTVPCTVSDKLVLFRLTSVEPIGPEQLLRGTVASLPLELDPDSGCAAEACTSIRTTAPSARALASVAPVEVQASVGDWLGRQQLAFFPTRSTFSEASANCAALGSRLVSLTEWVDAVDDMRSGAKLGNILVALLVAMYDFGNNGGRPWNAWGISGDGRRTCGAVQLDASTVTVSQSAPSVDCTQTLYYMCIGPYFVLDPPPPPPPSPPPPPPRPPVVPNTGIRDRWDDRFWTFFNVRMLLRDADTRCRTIGGGAHVASLGEWYDISVALGVGAVNRLYNAMSAAMFYFGDYGGRPWNFWASGGPGAGQGGCGTVRVDPLAIVVTNTSLAGNCQQNLMVLCVQLALELPEVPAGPPSPRPAPSPKPKQPSPRPPPPRPSPISPRPPPPRAPRPPPPRPPRPPPPRPPRLPPPHPRIVPGPRPPMSSSPPSSCGCKGPSPQQLQPPYGCSPSSQGYDCSIDLGEGLTLHWSPASVIPAAGRSLPSPSPAPVTSLCARAYPTPGDVRGAFHVMLEASSAGQLSLAFLPSVRGGNSPGITGYRAADGSIRTATYQAVLVPAPGAAAQPYTASTSESYGPGPWPAGPPQPCDWTIASAAIRLPPLDTTGNSSSSSGRSGNGVGGDRLGLCFSAAAVPLGARALDAFLVALIPTPGGGGDNGDSGQEVAKDAGAVTVNYRQILEEAEVEAKMGVAAGELPRMQQQRQQEQQHPAGQLQLLRLTRPQEETAQEVKIDQAVGRESGRRTEAWGAARDSGGDGGARKLTWDADDLPPIAMYDSPPPPPMQSRQPPLAPLPDTATKLGNAVVVRLGSGAGGRWVLVLRRAGTAPGCELACGHLGLMVGASSQKGYNLTGHDFEAAWAALLQQGPPVPGGLAMGEVVGGWVGSANPNFVGRRKPAVPSSSPPPCTSTTMRYDNGTLRSTPCTAMGWCMCWSVP